MGITSRSSSDMEEVSPTTENDGSVFSSDGEESLSFVENDTECCVGIVDIVGSTKTTAGLSYTKIGKYYSTFLNTMTPIVKKFGGIVVKNGGDSLLYYFQGSKDDEKPMFLRCLECSLVMIEARCSINKKLYREKIPPLSFRVSADYGKVTLAKSSNSSYHDIFGTPVNICSKINAKAQPNTLVIGGDLHQTIKSLPGYSFCEVPGYAVGFKFQYPVYSVTRNYNQCKSIVGNAIEQSLLNMGTPVLINTSCHLFSKYNCFLSTCYEKPECLRDVLIDMFGNAHTGILDAIKRNLGDYVQQKPIIEFLEKLNK